MEKHIFFYSKKLKELDRNRPKMAKFCKLLKVMSYLSNIENISLLLYRKLISARNDAKTRLLRQKLTAGHIPENWHNLAIFGGHFVFQDGRSD